MHNELGNWLAIGLLMLAGAAFTLLLRWARARGVRQTDVEAGWSILGGMLAGLVFGASVFGRVLPLEFERMFRGGVAERVELDRTSRRQGADLIAAHEAGSGLEQVSQLREQHQRELNQVTANWQAAQWRDETLMRVFTLITIALVMFSSAAFVIPRGLAPHGVLTPLSIGLWAAALPGAAIFAAMMLLGMESMPTAAIVAAALAIGPWAIANSDRTICDNAELGGARLMQSAGRVSSIVAIGVAIWWLAQIAGVNGLWMGSVLLALPASWMIAPLFESRRIENEAISSNAAANILRPVLEFILLPTLAALVMVKIDVLTDFALLPMILVLLASDDGRWLGAFIGTAILGNRSAATSLRLSLASMAAGPTQLCIAAAALAMHAIPNQFACALLLGCLLIEFTAPVRAALSKRIVEAQSSDEF